MPQWAIYSSSERHSWLRDVDLQLQFNLCSEAKTLNREYFVSTDTEKAMKNSDHSNSSVNNGGQDNQNPNKFKNDLQSDRGSHASVTAPSKIEELTQRDGNSKKDVDRERHPEEQTIKDKDSKKNDQKLGDMPRKN